MGDKEKYKSLGNGFKLTVAEQGVRGLFLGWAPTAIGYSMQGLCKFGFYEFFKNTYSNMIGEENTYLYKTSLYLAASASAEFFADIALSPMEAVKVKMQTSKLGTFPTTLRSAAPTLYRAEGLNGFYKSLVPQCGAETKGPVQQVRAVGRHIRRRLHRRSLLCRRLPPRRHPGVLHEQGAGRHSRLWRQGPRLCGTLGWTWPEDYHDWNSNSTPVVHLRCRQGSTASAETTATTDAREPEEKAWSGPGIGILDLVPTPAQPKCHHSVDIKSAFSHAFKFRSGSIADILQTCVRFEI